MQCMVDIAQSVEHLIVVQEVACSSHVIHPGKKEAGTKVPASCVLGKNLMVIAHRQKTAGAGILKFLRLLCICAPICTQYAHFFAMLVSSEIAHEEACIRPHVCSHALCS